MGLLTAGAGQAMELRAGGYHTYYMYIPYRWLNSWTPAAAAMFQLGFINKGQSSQWGCQVTCNLYFSHLGIKLGRDSPLKPSRLSRQLSGWGTYPSKWVTQKNHITLQQVLCKFPVISGITRSDGSFGHTGHYRLTLLVLVR